MKVEPASAEPAEEKPPTQEQLIVEHLRELIRNGKYTFIDRDVTPWSDEDEESGLVVIISRSNFYIILNGTFLTHRYLTEKEFRELWLKHYDAVKARKHQEDADGVKKELEKCLPCSALLR